MDVKNTAAIAVSVLTLLGVAVSYGILQHAVSTNTSEVEKLRTSVADIRKEVSQPHPAQEELLAQLRADVQELKSTAEKHEKAIDKLSYSVHILSEQLAAIQVRLGQNPVSTTAPFAR